MRSFKDNTTETSTEETLRRAPALYEKITKGHLELEHLRSQGTDNTVAQLVRLQVAYLKGLTAGLEIVEEDYPLEMYEDLVRALWLGTPTWLLSKFADRVATEDCGL